MKEGAKWLTKRVLAGGLLATLASGCGGPDTPTGPEWTSTVPAAPPTETTVPLAPPETVPLSTTPVPTTIVSVPVEPPGAFMEPDPVPESAVPTRETLPPRSEDTSIEGLPDTLEEPGEEGEPEDTHVDQDWTHLEPPEPDAPPVEDPERIGYAQDQIQKIYFTWFDAIYRKDPDALWGAVVYDTYHQRGVAAMDTMTFTGPPTWEGVEVTILELHIDHPDCLVASYEMDIRAFRDVDGLIDGAIVMWPHPDYGWRRQITFGLPTIYGIWWANCFLMDRSDTP